MAVRGAEEKGEQGEQKRGERELLRRKSQIEVLWDGNP